MPCNLTWIQIILIILGIIILIWLINWLASYMKRQELARRMTRGNNLQQRTMTPTSSHLSYPQQMTPLNIGDENVNQDSHFKLHYFYNPNCGPCKEFTPIWNEVVAKLKNVKGINVKAIDVTMPKNESFSFYYNVNNTPTVILVTPDRNIEYTGANDVNEFHDFIYNNIKEYTY